MKSVITAMLALGVGFAATASAAAAAAPSTAAGLSTALAASDPVQLAATVEVRPVVRPGVVRPGVRPVGPRVVPGRAVVVPGRAVVVPGRPVGVVGRPAYVRPGFVGRPVVVGRPVFVRAYRPWYRRPYFGTIVGGVALGTILTVAAVGVAPEYPPADGLCWYWADPSMTTGYWDYCQ